MATPGVMSDALVKALASSKLGRIENVLQKERGEWCADSLQECGHKLFNYAIKKEYLDVVHYYMSELEQLKRSSLLNSILRKSNASHISEIYSSALVVASEAGNLEIVNLLLAAGADPHYSDEEPLRQAVFEGHTELIHLFLSKGANIYVAEGIWDHLAEQDNVVMMKVFLEHAKTLKRPPKQPWICVESPEAALRRAAECDSRGVVELLLESGIDMTEDNNAAMVAAVESHNYDILRLMLKYVD